MHEKSPCSVQSLGQSMTTVQLALEYTMAGRRAAGQISRHPGLHLNRVFGDGFITSRFSALSTSFLACKLILQNVEMEFRLSPMRLTHCNSINVAYRITLKTSVPSLIITPPYICATNASDDFASSQRHATALSISRSLSRALSHTLWIRV